MDSSSYAYLSDSENCSQITFLTDAPSLEEFGYRKPEYHLRALRGGRFSMHGVLGEISLKHFCKKAIAAKISIDGEATPEKKIEVMVHIIAERISARL